MTLAEEQESQVYDMVTESDNYENDEGKDQSEGNDNEEKLVNGDKTEEDKPEEAKTEEDKTEEDKSKEDKPEEDKAEEDKTTEDKPEEAKTEEDKAEEDKTEEDKAEEKESDDEYKPEEKESEDEESDNELLITPTKEKTKTKKPKLVIKGTKTVIKQVNGTRGTSDCAPNVPNLSDKDMEKTDEEPSDMESETEMNEITGFPVYKSKNIKFGQLYMNKNKLIYVTKDNDTIKDVENVLSNTKLKKGCLVHVPGVEFEVYTGKPRGRPPKGKTWDDSNKEWIEKGTLKRKLNEDFDDEVQIKVVRF